MNTCFSGIQILPVKQGALKCEILYISILIQIRITPNNTLTSTAPNFELHGDKYAYSSLWSIKNLSIVRYAIKWDWNYLINFLTILTFEDVWSNWSESVCKLWLHNIMFCGHAFKENFKMIFNECLHFHSNFFGRLIMFVNMLQVTTDLRKTCTVNHTGTSASAPLAAGICALALESKYV